MTVPALEIAHCYQRCEQITRHEAANFYYGIRLLPRDRRDAMCAVYAFARRIDDIGDDGSLGAEQQLEALAAERAMLHSFGDPRAGGSGVRAGDVTADALFPDQVAAGVGQDQAGLGGPV